MTARLAGDRGQASIELVGALPALLLVGLVACQLLAVGYAKVLAAEAAEAAALATAGGTKAEEAARAAVPGWSRAGMRVRVAAGSIRVTMHAPSLIPAVRRRLTVAASAALADRSGGAAP